MHRVLNYIYNPAPSVKVGNFRSFRVLSVGSIVAVMLHLSYVFIFLALGLYALVLFNLLLSIPVYLVGFYANRNGRPFITVLLAQFELMFHQSLCIWMIGWDAGMQYYLLSTAGVVFLLPTGRKRFKLFLLATAAVDYELLLWFSSTNQPLYTVSPLILYALNYINITALFALLGFFSWNYHKGAEVAEARLEEERHKSEELLHNILPVAIAERLKKNPKTIADGFTEATILFADIVDFSLISQNLAPEQLISFLSGIFSEFDHMVQQRGLEKIKTIGDAYMVAAGIPEPRADHVEAIADLALEMMAAMGKYRGADGKPLKIRIGLHVGPVVAGVIGCHKFAYDLWGDSVNIAARMESHGIPGEIQVSQPVYEKLRTHFMLEQRGVIKVKGKGHMNTWLLKGRIKVSDVTVQPLKVASI